MKPVRIIFVGLICGVVSTARADIASVQWVRSIISAIEPPAQAQADWGQTDTTADDYIKNKPTLGSAALANVSSGVGAAGITDGGTGLVTGDQVYEYVAANAGASNFIEDSITDGTTNKAPSENAVHDALALKQDIQIGVAGDAGKAVVVANDGTMTISSSALGSAAYRDVASSIADNVTGLTTGDQVYDALATKVNTAQGNGNANKAVITDASGNITTGTISSGMITDGTIVDADVNANAAISTGKSALPTGWTNGNSSAALAAGDTVSVALGKLEKQIAGKQASGSYVTTSTTVNGSALSSDITLDGTDIALTGYTKPGSTSAVSASDTINAAIGKLEAGILPVGTTSGTVAAGDDTRFDSVPTTQPSGTPPTGRVWVWFN